MATETRLTDDDYAAVPDDGKRYELIRGELVELTSPAPAHQRLLKRLVLLLNSSVEGHDLGEVFFAPFDVKLSALRADVLTCLSRTSYSARRSMGTRSETGSSPVGRTSS